MELALLTRVANAGVTVYASETSLEDFELVWLEKLRRALDLIERTSPATATLLRRHAPRIVVHSVVGHDCVTDMGLIRLHGPALHHLDAAHVALIIIHELTHARLASRGMEWLDARERHERICTRAEVRFALRLPDGDAYIAAITAKLDHPWWTNDELRERARKQVDRMNLPRPLDALFRRSVEKRVYPPS